MPRLVLYCTRKIDLPRMEALEELSEEQVTGIVSEAFQRYNASAVCVSSQPVVGQSATWKGKCQVGDTHALEIDAWAV